MPFEIEVVNSIKIILCYSQGFSTQSHTPLWAGCGGVVSHVTIKSPLLRSFLHRYQDDSAKRWLVILSLLSSVSFWNTFDEKFSVDKYLNMYSVLFGGLQQPTPGIEVRRFPAS